jgi:hypothetical protein
MSQVIVVVSYCPLPMFVIPEREGRGEERATKFTIWKFMTIATVFIYISKLQLQER